MKSLTYGKGVFIFEVSEGKASVYEVKCVVAKHVKGAEYLIHWKILGKILGKILESQPSTCPKISSLSLRTDLLIHFTSMNAERDSLFCSRRI